MRALPLLAVLTAVAAVTVALLATAPPALGHHSFAAQFDADRPVTLEGTTGWVMPLAPPDWELMEYACTDNNRDAEEGFLRPGALDGSGRDGTATATPSTYR